MAMAFGNLCGCFLLSCKLFFINPLGVSYSNWLVSWTDIKIELLLLVFFLLLLSYSLFINTSTYSSAVFNTDYIVTNIVILSNRKVFNLTGI